MAEYRESKTPILKDNSFWSTVYQFWNGVEVIAFFFISLSEGFENPVILLTIYFSVLYVSETILAVVSYTLVKNTSLVRVILRRIVPITALCVFSFLTVNLPRGGDELFRLVFAGSIAVVIFTGMFVIFQKNINASKGIINYLFGDIVPDDVDQKEKERKNRTISKIFIFVFFGAYIVWYIIARIIL
jgi:hypothetical protein